MKKIAVFASHNGSVFDTIYQHTKSSQDSINLIISNNTNANILKKGEKYNIPSIVVNNTVSDNIDEEIILLLEKYKCNFIILAGYMKKISPILTQKYTIINSHPALLPKYGGKGMYGRFVHEAVINNKEQQSGVTIHYVNENYDEGAIIIQKSISLSPVESVDSLEQKIKELEKQAIIEALQRV